MRCTVLRGLTLPGCASYPSLRTAIKENSYISIMNTKEKLIDRISHINDERILEEIMQIVELELEMTGDILHITDEQKSFIDEGLKDIENGDVLSNEQAKKMTSEWLKKK
jgi:predicted transcriptional regulator